MKRKILGGSSLVLGLVLIMSSLIGPAGAASATGDVTVSATVPLSGTLALKSWDQDTTAHDPATSANFTSITISGTTKTQNAAAADEYAVEATIQTNSINWALTQNISAGQLLNGGNSIDLLWKADAGAEGTYATMGLSGSPDTIGSDTTPTAGSTYKLDYAILVPWTKPAGTYSGTVTYTFTYN